MIIKAELHEGKAYLLDSSGNIWKVMDIVGGVEINIFKIYKALPHEVEQFMLPTLATYETGR